MKTIVLKISGELFKAGTTEHGACINVTLVKQIVSHIKQLTQTHQISVVIGGGNFFRGCKEGLALGLRSTTADTIGMLATVMNSLILRDFFYAENIPCILLGAQSIPGVVDLIDQSRIDQAKKENNVIIFAGGTGCPFFSTDTAGVIRALQVNATELWKATKVDYVYDTDPEKNPQAKPLKKISYAYAQEKHLKVMDETAITLAAQHNVTIRVFSLFALDALLKVAQDADFGSTIHN